MNCDKFEQRMHYLLDRRRRPELDAQLTAHAQSCLDCRSTLAVQESLLDSLEMLETPEMSDDFNQRVLASVATATPAKSNGRSHRRLFRGLAALAAVAAVLMVALIPLLSREGASQKDGGAHNARSHSPPCPARFGERQRHCLHKPQRCKHPAKERLG